MFLGTESQRSNAGKKVSTRDGGANCFKTLPKESCTWTIMSWKEESFVRRECCRVRGPAQIAQRLRAKFWIVLIVLVGLARRPRLFQKFCDQYFRVV